MFFNKKKKLLEEFQSTFGKIKSEAFNFILIGRFFTKKDNTAAYHTISDKTCNDLDFEELFMFLDRTTSKVGQQYLYSSLRTIDHPTKSFEVQENIIDKLNQSESEQFELFKNLKRLSNRETYFINALFQESFIKKPSWYILIPILSIISFLCVIFSFFKGIFILPFIVLFLINSVIHYWNKRNVYQYLDSIPQLVKLNEVAKSILETSTFKQFKSEYNEPISDLNDIKLKMQLLKVESKMDSDFAVFGWAITELFKTAFLLEPILLFGILKRLETKKSSVERIYSFVGWADTCLSILSLRKNVDNYCIPQVSDTQKAIEFEDLRHPLIVDCTSNSIKIDQKSVLLTGSNMSGKTTFIRSIGVSVITSMTINMAFADSFRIPYIKLHSAIRISDDLMNDKSYYLEEVLCIKDMITECEGGHQNLFLLDEIFKGTNTIERIASGKAVLSHLNQGNNLTFVSTHDIELADLLAKEYDLYHFSEQVNDNKIEFDYKLKEGKLKDRNAIRILQLNKYPQNLVDEAISITSILDIPKK